MKTKHLLIFSGFIAFIFFWLYLLTQPAFIKSYNFSDTGQLGDTIGGLTAPLIGIVGSILVYVSFQEQFKANKIQIKALNDERIRYNAERWYSLNLNRLADIKNSFQSLKFKIPIGENEQVMKFDNAIDFKGFIAIIIIKDKLKKYRRYHKYQRLAIDIYIFELGYCLKQLQQLGDEIRLDERFPDEKKLITSNITSLYNDYMKYKFNQIIKELNNDNDPNNLKDELVKTVNSIESMINSDFSIKD